MKILVDEMPEEAYDCLLAARNHCTGQWSCRMNGLPCVLAAANVCPYLVDIKNRCDMRDVNRLYEFYDELLKIHVENFPDWRFGQFIWNFESWLRETKKIYDIFYIEETAMLRYIDEFVDAVK